MNHVLRLAVLFPFHQQVSCTLAARRHASAPGELTDDLGSGLHALYGVDARPGIE